MSQLFNPSVLNSKFTGNILYIDMITKPIYGYNIHDMPKYQMDFLLNRKKYTDSDFYKTIYQSEFSKVAVITIGFVKDDTFQTMQFSDDDEEILLNKFAKVTSSRKFYLCGSELAIMVVPFLIKRMIINNIQVVPQLFDYVNQKPWESMLIDLTSIWKFGSYELSTILSISKSMGIPTNLTKETIDLSLNPKVTQDELMVVSQELCKLCYEVYIKIKNSVSIE